MRSGICKRKNAFYEAAAEMSIDKAMQKIEPITKKDRLIEQAKSLLFKTGLIRLVIIVVK